MSLLLFLIFINDIASGLSPGTRIRLFADDCLVYRPIKSLLDQLILQEDLLLLEKWSNTWGMYFNPAKCNILSTRPDTKNHLHHFYMLYGVVLKEVETAKYLGVLLSNTLSWSPHIDTVACKASQKLGFIRCYLMCSPMKSKCMAYSALVRSGMEYAAPIWDPATQKDISKLETIQRRAARWAKSVFYDRQVSVTKLLHELEWAELADRRKYLRLVLLYKVVNNHVDIQFSELGIEPNTRPSRRNSKQLFRPRSKTDTHKNSFVIRTISDWNSLPEESVSAGSVNAFKSQAAVKP